MNGKRVYHTEPHQMAPGEFGRWDRDNGNWYARCPSRLDLTANLTRHSVTEHEDGTITVSPSILVEGGNGESWHGYLEHGVWREA